MLVTLEGGEGAGKTTLAARLEAALKDAGFEVVRTREPGGSMLSEQIRAWLLRTDQGVSLCERAELLLFLASRAQHVEELIRPALDEGKVVLCDRFNDSTVAYQGLARGMGKNWVEELCDWATGGIQPSVTFLLDIPPEEGLARSLRVPKAEASEGTGDRMEAEGLAFHRKVWLAYHELAARDPSRFQVLNALRPADEVFGQAWEILKTRL